jgi:predicted RNA-binding Zn ribbon-like protein
MLSLLAIYFDRAVFFSPRPDFGVTTNIIIMVTSPVKYFCRLFSLAVFALRYYIGYGMKNRELLKTGQKPAPGDLVLIQGFVNTLDIEAERDELDSVGGLKKWLVRHGLLGLAMPVGENDLKEWVAFREALRALLRKNGGERLDRAVIRRLNRMAGELNLKIGFNPDGAAQLSSTTTQGVAGAIGQMLLIIMNSVLDGSWWRLKSCSESNCLWAFYDSSKNRSGRWCSMSVCGSREKARAYRKRKAGSK